MEIETLNSITGLVGTGIAILTYFYPCDLFDFLKKSIGAIKLRPA